MRITYEQKAEIYNILDEINLDRALFEFSGEADFFIIKFKEDYFEFNIRVFNNKYAGLYKSIYSDRLAGPTGSWDQLKDSFSKWAKEIKSDIAYKPTSNNFILTKNMHYEEMAKYSKQFVLIYNQAYQAEINNLSEICGLGYRKAFEFLIKDYVIKKNRKIEPKRIKDLPIMQCINNYTAEEIKVVSERVLWLGNDHAHYIKKWKGKTLEDLKDLIKITIDWIKLKEETGIVKKSMPNKKHIY